MKLLQIVLVATTAILWSATGFGQTVNIDNGITGVGHLDLNVDAYGAYGGFNPAYTDHFEPLNGGSIQPTFTAGFRLFAGFDRVLLTDMPEWNTILMNPTWSVSISRPVSNVDSFTAFSSFEVLDSDDSMLSFEVTQTVTSASAGVAILDQIYEITNVSGSGFEFCMNRVLDADLVWGTPGDDDHVAVSDPPGIVSQHEPGSLSQGIALTSGQSGIPHNFYWAGKDTHEPTGGSPAFGFGTDNVVWTNRSLPESWRNYVAYSGYETPGGDSGLVKGQDAHVGLDWTINLAGGATTTLHVRTIYGGEDCVSGDVDLNGVVDLLDVSPFVIALTNGTYQCEADVDSNGVVDLLDVSPFVDILNGN